MAFLTTPTTGTICSLPDQRRRKVERQLMAENNTAVATASGLSRSRSPVTAST